MSARHEVHNQSSMSVAAEERRCSRLIWQTMLFRPLTRGSFTRVKHPLAASISLGHAVPVSCSPLLPPLRPAPAAVRHTRLSSAYQSALHDDIRV